MQAAVWPGTSTKQRLEDSCEIVVAAVQVCLQRSYSKFWRFIGYVRMCCHTYRIFWKRTRLQYVPQHNQVILQNCTLVWHTDIPVEGCLLYSTCFCYFVVIICICSSSRQHNNVSNNFRFTHTNTKQHSLTSTIDDILITGSLQLWCWYNNSSSNLNCFKQLWWNLWHIKTSATTSGSHIPTQQHVDCLMQTMCPRIYYKYATKHTKTGLMRTTFHWTLYIPCNYVYYHIG